MPLMVLMVIHARARVCVCRGHGTDCYVLFNRMSDANTEQTLQIPSFEAARDAHSRKASDTEEQPNERPNERPNQGRWRHAIRLFDAQARRRPEFEF